MVPIMSLWLPILVSAIFVWVASFIMHSFLPYHKKDYVGVPAEDETREFLRKTGISPGEYVIPFASDMKQMMSPEHRDKMNKGPVAYIRIIPNGPMSGWQKMAGWFVYSLVIGVFAAYIAGRALEPGAHYLSVFRFVGAVSFFCYAVAWWQESLFLNKPWGTMMKYTFDGLVFALLTAGTFGWLWPQM